MYKITILVRLLYFKQDICTILNDNATIIAPTTPIAPVTPPHPVLGSRSHTDRMTHTPGVDRRPSQRHCPDPTLPSRVANTSSHGPLFQDKEGMEDIVPTLRRLSFGIGHNQDYTVQIPPTSNPFHVAPVPALPPPPPPLPPPLPPPPPSPPPAMRRCSRGHTQGARHNFWILYMLRLLKGVSKYPSVAMATSHGYA